MRGFSNEAKAYIKENCKGKVKSQLTFNKWTKGQIEGIPPKPISMPSQPWVAYLSDSGWVDAANFFGSDNIHGSKKNYRKFLKARSYARKLNLSTRTAWTKLHRENKIPKDIPQKPDIFYKTKGWIDWSDWLNTSIIATFDLNFLTFKAARKYVQLLKFTSQKDWYDYCKSGKKPRNIPSNPDKAYKDLGWVSYPDWVGFDWDTFENAKAYAKKLNLNNEYQWKKYYLSNHLPENIPTHPDRTYANKGWKGWSDFLGTEVIANFNKEFYPFEVAKKLLKKINVKSKNDYYKKRKSKILDSKFPSSPQMTYKNEGWISWGDYLGTNSFKSGQIIYLKFTEARNFARAQGLLSKKEWSPYITKMNRNDLPKSPDQIYKNKGWNGWPDFLGKK